MKLFLTLSLISFSFALSAQYNFTINLVDTQGKAVSNTEITAVNGDDVVKETTNISGSATFVLTQPGTYSFSYLDEKDVCTFEVKEGFSGNSRRTITYDPDKVFAINPEVDRSKVSFKTVNGFHHINHQKAIKVIVYTKERTGRGVSSLPITVVSVGEGLKFEGTTDGSGKATFYLRVDAQYEIDIDGIESFQSFKLPNLGQGGTYTEVVYFEKPRIAEQMKGDTIIQHNIKETSGTSTHVLFTLVLKNYDGIPLVDEPVYAKADEGNRVYEGVTDDEGKCTFLLKKGVDYFINLKYESDITYIKCRLKKGFARYQVSRSYRGSDAIEQMLKERHANELGFVVNHDQTPIRTAPKPSGYLSQLSNGYKLDFGTHGPSSTPTVVGDNLYTASCYYCPEFYCLDANTGAYKWGVILGESGISPAVYHNGVILINTESCTLYALDAQTGELLWSKWLAGYLYTTPSADRESVYVVYNNGGDNPVKPGIEHVLASFDLRTGKTNWMQWIDNEAIACPVVYKDEVHVSSQRGTYYIFDREKGNLKKSNEGIHAISSPTVSENGIFLTTQQNGKEQLVVLDRTSLAVKRRYGSDLDPTIIGANTSLFEFANFNGSHPVVYKNEKVLVLDNSKLRVFDAKSERLLWEKAVDVHANQVPVIIDGRAYVATNDGTLRSFDLSNGSEKTEANVAEGLESQPILSGKRLILSAAGILTVIKSALDPDWQQWNKDAQHNLLLE